MSLSEKLLSNEEMLGVSGGSGQGGGYKIRIIQDIERFIYNADGTLSNEKLRIPGGTIIEMLTSAPALGQIAAPYMGKFVMLYSGDYEPVR